MKMILQMTALLAVLTVSAAVLVSLDRGNKREIAHHVCAIAGMKPEFLSDGVWYTCIKGDTQ
jgi:hypothetical protein